MRDRLALLMMTIAVACAVLTTGLAWKTSRATRAFEQGRRVEDWRRYSQVGVASGPSDAPIVLVEFLDFQCPACKMFSYTLDSVVSREPQRFRLVRRHFPLMQMHPWASRLARGGVCAARFGVFDEYYHQAFDVQPLMDAMWDGLEALFPPSVPRRDLRECLANEHTVDAINIDLEDASRLHLRGTPALLINDKLYAGAWSVRQLDSLLMRVR